MLHRRSGPGSFRAFARPAKRLAPGNRLVLGRALHATVVSRGEHGEVELRFPISGTALDEAVRNEGEMPLPPYIARKRPPDLQDAVDYQTMFSRHEGSVAAPTAGLHFTPELDAALAARGISRAEITLHVGAGTFQPVSVEDTRDHRMHPEWAEIQAGTAAHINTARDNGGRIVAVGTTSLRTLESAANDQGHVTPFRAETELFITPGYRFRAVDILLTNFHLPRSTLFMLVCAFMGTDIAKQAYAEAVSAGYRFYSYGDACLFFRDRS